MATKMTEEQKKAARKETYRKYNAKRYVKTPDAELISIPGVKVKQTAKQTRYTLDGKAISQNKLKKLVPNKDQAKAIRKAEIEKVAKNRKKFFDNSQKKHLGNGSKTTEVVRFKELRDAKKIYNIKVNSAKYAVDVLVSGSAIFTDEEKLSMKLHSERFSLANAQGSRKNFWEIYDEIADRFVDEYGPGSRDQVRFETDRDKIKEMFEAQLGESYTRQFLPFLY